MSDKAKLGLGDLLTLWWALPQEERDAWLERLLEVDIPFSEEKPKPPPIQPPKVIRGFRLPEDPEG